MLAEPKTKAPTEDDLIALEHALGDYQVAGSDYDCGLSFGWIVERKYRRLETLCLAAGMSPGQDPEAFAALATVGGV